jgi:uncharacterized protein
MKASRYNFFYNFSGDLEKLIAYNARTNSLALIEKENFNKYKNFIDNSVPIDDEKLIEDLKKGQFLIEDDIDELDLLKYNMFNSRFDTRHLGMTIAPTMNCNFDCVYCYEKNERQSQSMSLEVQDRIVEFARQQTKYVEGIDIAWYGGEPLLAFDVVKNISGRIMEICKEKGVRYSSFIVTNGYGLNKEISEEIKKMDMKFVQITLDGPEDIHDRRRPLRGGQGTFHKILENIAELIDVLPDISLRVNVDKENADRVNEILEELSKMDLGNKVHTYLGYVEPINGCYSVGKCLTTKEYSNIDFKFDNELKKVGFVENNIFKYPNLKTSFCGADRVNSLVIDPKGNIYKCWSDIGIDEYKVGNIMDNIPINTDKYMGYMLYDPTHDNECRDCSFLPLCMGGCPRRRMDGKIDRCSGYKYVFKEYLEKAAIVRKKELLKDVVVEN